MTDIQKTAFQAMDVSRQMGRMLAGLSSDLQGAILADLLSIWIAGHAPDLREDVIKLHIELMRPLIDVNEKIIFGPAGHPGR